MEALTASQAAAMRLFNESDSNMLVMGKPGCGKSYLLKAMQRVCESKGLRHHTLAMRGHNAHDVKGSTIHSRIVPLPNGRSICKTNDELISCIWRALQGDLGGNPGHWKVKARTAFWTSLDVLFVDEVFLVDAGMFALMETYARRIRAVDEPFGGLRVCIMGDPSQMGPRGDGSVHVFRPVCIGKPPDAPDEEEKEDDMDEKYMLPSTSLHSSIESVELRPFDDANFQPIVLTENKRQEGEDQTLFREVLDSISRGGRMRDMSNDHKAFLEKMCVDKIPDSTYALFWSREDASKRNQDCNDRVTGDVLAELAVDVSMSGTVSEQISSQRDKFIADLPLEGKVIVVKEGAPMMLLTNMDVSKGAYRGAIGTVSDVVRGEEDAITSIKLVMHDGSEFLVEPRVEVIEDESSKCTISFWPLGYGFAGTYDSAQGKTIARLAIGVTPRMPPGMLYVGMSRVRRYQDLSVFANVNKYNANSNTFQIFLMPSLTRSDLHVDRFVDGIRKTIGHAVCDADTIQELMASKKRRRSTPVEMAGCAICGETPQVVFSCGHVVSCSECWVDAKKAGIMTCFKCGAPVVRAIKVCIY